MTTPAWDVLYSAVAQAAATMPLGHLTILADRITEHDTPATAWAITREPPVQAYTHAASRILRAWEDLPDGVTGATVGTAIGAAAATRTHLAARETVTLAWTGPDTTHLRATPTSSTITDVINSARRTLLLVSFATRAVKTINDTLRAAATRGVDISILTETETASEGAYQGGAHDAFDGVPATRYVWATDRRPRINGHVPVMHAKIVLADDHTVFITSANLTGRALDHNIEAGTLIRGGPIPTTLYHHFRSLAYNSVIKPNS